MGIRGVQESISNTIPTLVERAQQHDSRAFEELVQQLGDRIWRSALVMCRDETAARDLVQETWLEAWKSLHRFDGRCMFSTWLHGILRHRYLKLVRRQTRKPLVLMPEPGGEQQADPAQPHPGAAVQQHEGRLAMNLILASLPDEQRKVLELRFFADCAATITLPH